MPVIAEVREDDVTDSSEELRPVDGYRWKTIS